MQLTGWNLDVLVLHHSPTSSICWRSRTDESVCLRINLLNKVNRSPIDASQQVVSFHVETQLLHYVFASLPLQTRQCFQSVMEKHNEKMRLMFSSSAHHLRAHLCSLYKRKISPSVNGCPSMPAYFLTTVASKSIQPQRRKRRFRTKADIRYPLLYSVFKKGSCTAKTRDA